MLQRTLPAGFIAPCLPTKAATLPSGRLWLREIKHDGFRIIARKSDGRVRLYSRPGNDFTRRFTLIVETLARLHLRSCIIDVEAVACDGKRPEGIVSKRARPIAPSGAAGREEGRPRGLGMSYLSITDTVTLTSDTPAILSTSPETWTVNSS
jgi:hypothetical protein